MKHERMTMRLDDVMLKRVARIQEITGARTATRAVEYALVVANYILNEQERGQEIVSRKKEKARRGTNPRDPQAVVNFIFG